MGEEHNENLIEPTEQKLLRCSVHNRMIFGICGGLSEYFRINSAVIRLLFILFFLVGGAGLIFYILFGFIIPVDFSNNEVIPSDEIRIHFEKKLFVGLSLIFGGVILFIYYLELMSTSYFAALFEHKIFPFVLIAAGILFISKKNTFEEKIMTANEPKKLTLSNNKMIFGVCGGIGEYLNIDPTIVRVLWVIFLFASFGIALIIYIVLKFIIPPKNE